MSSRSLVAIEARTPTQAPTRPGLALATATNAAITKYPVAELLGSSELCYKQSMVRFLPAEEDFSDSDSSHSPSSTNGGAGNLNAILGRIQILTTQGHLESAEPAVTSLVEARSQSGVIDQEAAEDCERRRFWSHHGVEVIGKVAWRVLGVEPD